MHPIFNYTLASYNASSVRLHRQWINTTLGDPSGTYRSADLYLTIPNGSSAHLDVTPSIDDVAPPVVNIISKDDASAIVRVAVVTNETSLVGLGPSQLFLSEGANGTQGLQTALQGLASGNNSVANQVWQSP